MLKKSTAITGAFAAAVLVVAVGCPSSASVVADTDDLVEALPTGRDLPPEWSSGGGEPATEAVRDSGPGVGFCSGPNAAIRAADVGDFSFANTPGFSAGPGSTGNLAIYSFADGDAAQAFMDATAELAESCPGGVEYEASEADFNMYRESDNPEIENAVWQVDEMFSIRSAVGDDFDDAFVIQKDVEFRRDGTQTGGRELELTQFERHDSYVIVTFMSGRCCTYGFSNTDAQVDDLPTVERLTEAADHLRPDVVDALAI